jgi:hypothetical protein
MKSKASNATPFLLGLLLLIGAALPCAAQDPPKSQDTNEHEMSPEARRIEGDVPDECFGPDPTKYEEVPYNVQEQLDIYAAKYMNETAQPIQTGIRLYDRGEYTPRPIFFGGKNPVNHHFMSFGDFRVAVAHNDNGDAPPANQDADRTVLAARLNLDMDFAITATERIHAFVRPLDKNGSFLQYQISGAQGDDFVDRFDFNLETLFFEGDLGAIYGGLADKPARFDLPIAFGRVPLLTQNGVWLNDAFNGLAFAITARNIPALDISNYDLTFFAGFDKVTTAAVPATVSRKEREKGRIYGVAGFADLRGGYAEFGYAYFDGSEIDSDLSYHNISASWSRRYWGRVSNSVRVIGNFGQSAATKTADGVLLLIENSFTRPNPVFEVPYINLFVGFDSPQSLARNADAGGVLLNTGILFESDGITNYPTLDATAKDSYGGAIGWGHLFPKLNSQFVVEGSVVERRGDSTSGDQYGVGVRYQHKIRNAWIVRADAMYGWLQGRENIHGVRLELRRKF